MKDATVEKLQAIAGSIWQARLALVIGLIWVLLFAAPATRTVHALWHNAVTLIGAYGGYAEAWRTPRSGESALPQTALEIVHLLRTAGATAVHFRVSAPPTISPCFYGVDTPTHSELVANNLSEQEICKYILADSLAYLSESGLYAFLGGEQPGFCDACFTRNYPVAVPQDQEHRQMKLFQATEIQSGQLRVVK